MCFYMCIISVSHPYLAASSPASLFVAVLCVRVCFSPFLSPSLPQSALDLGESSPLTQNLITGFRQGCSLRV